MNTCTYIQTDRQAGRQTNILYYHDSQYFGIQGHAGCISSTVSIAPESELLDHAWLRLRMANQSKGVGLSRWGPFEEFF